MPPVPVAAASLPAPVPSRGSVTMTTLAQPAKTASAASRTPPRMARSYPTRRRDARPARPASARRLDTDRAELELGDLAERIDHVVGEQVGSRFAEMERDEHAAA